MAAQATAFYTLGTLMPVIVNETDWSRSEIIGIGAALAVLSFVFAPVVGQFLDRFGGRRLALVGFILYPAGLASISLVGDAIWHWWLAWIGIGLAVQLINTAVWTFGVARNFVRNRGLAMGLTLSGAGLANAVLPLLSVSLLEVLPWRQVFAALGLIVFLIMMPMVWFFYPKGEVTKDAPESEQKKADLTGLTAPQTFSTTRYWRLCVAILFLAGTIGTINIHQQAMLIDAGSTAYMAAVIATAFGPAQIVGRLVGGFLLDRVSSPILGGALFLMPVASIAVLLSGTTSIPVVFIVPIMAGAAAGVEVDVAAYMASRYFGTRSYGTIFSIVFGFYAVGFAMSPLLAATIRDNSGSYGLVLIGMLCLVPTAALLVSTLGRYPRLGATISAKS